MRRRARGHNMLEMVMAVVLFSTVVVFLIGVWGTYSRAIGKARSVLVATYLGEEVMENCIAAKYANIELFQQGYLPPPPTGTNANPRTIVTRAMIRSREVLTTYKVWVDVDNNVAGPADDLVANRMKAVTVTVEWEEQMAVDAHSDRLVAGNKTRTLKFNTMISSNS